MTIYDQIGYPSLLAVLLDYLDGCRRGMTTPRMNEILFLNHPNMETARGFISDLNDGEGEVIFAGTGNSENNSNVHLYIRNGVIFCISLGLHGDIVFGKSNTNRPSELAQSFNIHISKDGKNYKYIRRTYYKMFTDDNNLPLTETWITTTHKKAPQEIQEQINNFITETNWKMGTPELDKEEYYQWNHYRHDNPQTNYTFLLFSPKCYRVIVDDSFRLLHFYPYCRFTILDQDGKYRSDGPAMIEVRDCIWVQEQPYYNWGKLTGTIVSAKWLWDGHHLSTKQVETWMRDMALVYPGGDRLDSNGYAQNILDPVIITEEQRMIFATDVVKGFQG